MLIKRCFLVFVVVELAAPQFLTAQQTPAPVDKVASVYGAKVHYVDAGTGSPVILLHGLADDVGVWESAMGPLTFHDKPFYEDVDLAFKQRLATGDSYTVGRILDSMIRGEDVLDNRLAAIKQPTLILWGREDKLIPLNFAERFHKEIAGSQLRVIDSCGHMPHVECPKEFVTAVLEFLRDTK